MSLPPQSPESLGECVCGKQKYESRKVARRVARRLHPDHHLGQYRCDESGWWHFGHTPRQTVRGRKSRRQAVDDNRRKRERREAAS